MERKANKSVNGKLRARAARRRLVMAVFAAPPAGQKVASGTD